MWFGATNRVAPLSFIETYERRTYETVCTTFQFGFVCFDLHFCQSDKQYFYSKAVSVVNTAKLNCAQWTNENQSTHLIRKFQESVCLVAIY